MPHEVGSIIEGKVTGITKFGAFIELDDGAVGMVHISEISHAYVSDISEYLKEGQVVKVKVLSVGDNGKISLSIKRALPQEGSASFKRERGERAGSASAGGRPQQGGRQNNFRARNGNNTHRRFYDQKSIQQARGPASFEDMLAKFMSSSDEKFSDMKQPERRRRPRKNYNDYD